MLKANIIYIVKFHISKKYPVCTLQLIFVICGYVCNHYIFSRVVVNSFALCIEIIFGEVLENITTCERFQCSDRLK